MEKNTCSFLAIVGGHCGSDTKDRTGSVEMVPLLSCNQDISRHMSFFSIIGIENKAELLLERASIFALFCTLHFYTFALCTDFVSILDVIRKELYLLHFLFCTLVYGGKENSANSADNFSENFTKAA